MLRPVMDTAFMVGLWSHNIAALGAVVEGARGDMCKVSKAVPLRATLRVEVIQVVVCDAVGEDFDFVLERLTAERGLAGYIEWKTEKERKRRSVSLRMEQKGVHVWCRWDELDGHNLASANLFGSRGHACRSKQIEAANLRKWVSRNRAEKGS